MGKAVRVSIKNTQINQWGERETIEFVTTGSLFAKNNSIYIMYKESAVSGLEGTTTTLKVEPHRVTLNRVGAVRQKQLFKEGTGCRGTYVTPYGSFKTRVQARKLEVNLTETGGSINLDYELELNQQKIGRNKLIITVKEV
ncbi:uncharacterized beta-barrel protein YwiB (DUF1934 family) [Desulfohalotomaculum tongense]|uniref:DUF1934 domain-containing protein n=1 Tax=Desulforadius tongensis TaxID=1216062 RepID=UPI00195625FC|nr:DUF1934 domain-containing protein [Desulforadius tongensis]MBM7853764.1 uncharacterized beta-barrel protein YwiB (DUF1934 family) [Desulforadius tongensis]